ncbi:MAG: hypothetical protein QOF35_40 [Actinomycetota bacterium]|nr:hypothetical protein [Actinomycetota bacterium]
MAPQPSNTVTFMDVVSWALEQGVLVPPDSSATPEEARRIAAHVVQVLDTLTYDVTARRELTIGFETVLNNMDFDYICWDNGITVPQWARAFAP